MQPAVRACVQSSKRTETAKGSSHCNITEFLQKWHGERVLHHLRRAKYSPEREENCDETSPRTRNNASGGMILLSSFFRQSMTYECDQFGDLEKPIRVHYSQKASQARTSWFHLLSPCEQETTIAKMWSFALHSKKRTVAPHEHFGDHRPPFTERSW
jgi:hypothetical protein